MTKMATVVGCAALLAAVSLPACGGGSVEGTYNFDRAGTKKTLEADAAKLTGKDKDIAKLGIAFADAMDGSLELKPGGAAVEKTVMGGSPGKPAPPKEEKGTWKKTEAGVTVTINGKDLRCALSGKSLTCRDPKTTGPGAIVYTKP
jgi:hypothetical protein